MPIEARFTSIELVPPVVPANICEATEEPIASAIFTLQDRQGKFFKFKHPDFDEFCAKAGWPALRGG